MTSFLHCLPTSGNFKHVFRLVQLEPLIMMIFLVFLTLFFVTVNGDLLEKYVNAPGNVYHGR